MLAHKALMNLGDAGKKAFITSNSQSGKYEVIAAFRSLEDMQAFYSALVAVGQVFQEEAAEVAEYHEK